MQKLFSSKTLFLLFSLLFLCSLAETTQNRKSSSYHSNQTHFTFPIDEAQLRAPDLRYLQTADRLLRGQTHLEGPLEDFSHKSDRKTKFLYTGLNGILGTVHHAYVNHLPLQLSVSDFILLIGQGISKHMQVHAEDVRPHFVDFEGKQTIIITRGDIMPGKVNDWSTVFGEFAEEIKKRVKLDFYDIMVDDTSVATKLSRIASEITIMDTFQKYFEYALQGCAMTKITLVGKTEDWEMLRNKVHKLKSLNENDKLLLDWWLEHLVPLIDKIVDQAVSRNVDVEFWKNIYSFNPRYRDCNPEPTMSGWIKYFKPYINEESGGNVRRSDFTTIYTSTLSNDISRVPLKWIPTPDLEIPMLIFGGVLGTKIHEDGTLEPEYFYAVAKKGQEVADGDSGCIQDDDAEGSCIGKGESPRSISPYDYDDYEEEEEEEEEEEDSDDTDYWESHDLNLIFNLS